VRPAELFKPDIEEFSRQALGRRNYAQRLRGENFNELRAELDEHGTEFASQNS